MKVFVKGVAYDAELIRLVDGISMQLRELGLEDVLLLLIDRVLEGHEAMAWQRRGGQSLVMLRPFAELLLREVFTVVHTAGLPEAAIRRRVAEAIEWAGY